MIKSIIAIIIITSLSFASFANYPNNYEFPNCLPNSSTFPIQPITSNNNYNGSAVLIEKDIWVTSAHLFEDDGSVPSASIRVDGEYVPGTIQYIDRVFDVAIIKADSGSHIPMKTTNELYADEKVWTIGYPGAANFRLMSFTGVILKAGYDGSVWTSSLVLPAMSGGAAMKCTDGVPELVGIIASFITDRVSESIVKDDDGNDVVVIAKINSGASRAIPLISYHLYKMRNGKFPNE